MTAIKHPTIVHAPLSFECELPDPPEKVWRALTVPELLAAWLMPNDITPEAGKRFAFATLGTPIECEVLDADPGKRLCYSWRERPATREPNGPMGFDSTVTFTLARTVSGGTLLRIVHDDFAVAQPAVTMRGSAGCGISLEARNRPVAANAPRMMLRAA
jgi:uncharacterized protein YndB with AHSA1/START domain